jgi:hypothetical protein
VKLFYLSGETVLPFKLNGSTFEMQLVPLRTGKTHTLLHLGSSPGAGDRGLAGAIHPRLSLNLSVLPLITTEKNHVFTSVKP